MYELGLVATGGAIGAVCRHLVNVGALRLVGAGFPTGTLLVNLAGCLLMGLAAGYLAFRYAGDSRALRLLLLTGMLGGFTTFSAFSLEAVQLWERGAAVQALLYVAISVAGSLMAVAIGLGFMRSAA